jgi:serine/threonine protein kinase
MAPEQASNAAGVGASADVFSFGVMAYELLTKQVPFLPPAVFRVMAHAPIPPPALKLAKLSGLAPAVGATLDACLSLDPTARPDAATLVQVLDGAAA